MANVNIKFNGKEFLLSCDDGQEEHLEELSNLLSKKFEELKSSLGNIGENKLLLITSIKIIDEYFETMKKVDNKKKELQLLKDKFLDLKKLVYQYKDEKESEIQTLVNEHEKLKKEINKIHENYSKIIENTTKQIDDFVNCAELSKSAGYDGVEIIGSAGYLISTFFVSKTNLRKDGYGGSFQNRTRFAKEIVQIFNLWQNVHVFVFVLFSLSS